MLFYFNILPPHMSIPPIFRKNHQIRPHPLVHYATKLKFIGGRRASGGALFEKSAAKTFAELVLENFTSFWDGMPQGGVPSAPSQDTDKESSLSFRCYGVWRVYGRRRRPKNDSDIGTTVVFALSFVWCKTKPILYATKVFAQPFSKGWPPEARLSPTNFNLYRQQKGRADARP